MKKLLIIGSLIVSILLCTSFANNPNSYIAELYSQDGRILILEEETREDLENEIIAHLAVGWFKEPQVLLYSINEQRYFNQSEVEAQLTVGWYTEPVYVLYSLDYRTEVVLESKVAEQLTVGWYRSKAEVDSIHEANKTALLAQKVSEDEKILLARVIYSEASDKSIEDRRAVGVVVINRVESSTYPNTISKVVYQKGQYACIKGSKFKKTPPQECLDIATQIINGERFGIPNNVIFQSQQKQGLGVWKKIGSHYYCYGRI